MESFNDSKRGKSSKFSISPRLKKLKEDFIQNGGKFEKYKIGKYFYVKGNPQLNKESFCFSKGAQYPYFTRTAYNNGILGYVDYLDEEHKIKGNSLAVGMIAMQFFYMEHDFYAGQFTKTVYPKFEKFNAKIAQYFISIFNKHQDLLKGVLVRDFENTFINSYIEFPMLNNQISFKYIESYIRELEEERIRELTTYLQVSGLEDYKLTEEEQEAINKINNKKVKFEKFTINELFEIATGRDFIIGNTEKGDIPLISHTNENNGLVVKIKEVKNRRIFDANKTIALADRGVFYATTQDKNFHIGTRVKALTFKEGAKSEEERLFITSSINKLQVLFTDYLTNATDKLPNLQIELPTTNNKIDYDFMKTYIKAIEKLVIKNVVDWRDKQISATKQIVNNV